MRLHNETVIPPGCFAYLVPETGVRVPPTGTKSINACYRAVQEHYISNKLTPPSGLRERIVEACCAIQTPGTCFDDDRPHPLPTLKALTTDINRFVTGTKAIASWLSKGKVDEEVAEQRAAICNVCEFNVAAITNCPSCQRSKIEWLKTFATSTLQGDPKPWEANLHNCSICGCSLRLKMRTRVEVIRELMSAPQQNTLPAHCWIKTEA